MTDDGLNIECDVSFEDIIAWNRYFIENNPVWQQRIRKIRTIGFPSAAVLLAAGVLLLAFGVTLIGGIVAVVLGVLGMAALLVFPGFVWKKVEKYLRKEYFYVPHKDVGSRTYEITADGIRIVTGKGATRLRWAEVKSIEQTPAYIYINIPPYGSAIIPRCAFADDASFDRVGRDLTDMFQRYRAGGKA